MFCQSFVSCKKEVCKKRLTDLYTWCTRTEVSERKASGGRFSERSRRRQEAKRAECIEAKVGDHVLRDTRTSRKAARFESRVHETKRICFLFFRWCTRTEVSERKSSGGRFSERSRRRQEAKRAECIEAKVGDHVLRDTRTSRNAARFESRVHKKSESIDSLFIGAPSGTRTLDPLIKSQLLYQLS